MGVSTTDINHSDINRKETDMYATIHSAEITHRQQAREFAREAELARIRAERPQDVVAQPSRLAKIVKALRPARVSQQRIAPATAN